MCEHVPLAFVVGVVDVTGATVEEPDVEVPSEGDNTQAEK